MAARPGDRYLCRYCKVWLGGDTTSRKHHDGGARHKKAVEALLVAQHEKNKKRRAENKLVGEELKKVNHAALASTQFLDLAVGRVQVSKEKKEEIEDEAPQEEMQTASADENNDKDPVTGFGQWVDVHEPKESSEVEGEGCVNQGEEYFQTSNHNGNGQGCKVEKQKHKVGLGLAEGVIFKRKNRASKLRKRRIR